MAEANNESNTQTLQAKLQELEAREARRREMMEAQLAVAWEREEHLHDLLREQWDDAQKTVEALRRARDEVKRKEEDMRLLEEEMCAMRVSTFHQHVDDAWASWAPKKKKPAPPRRPRKRIRQPQLPTRQSRRLEEKRLKTELDLFYVSSDEDEDDCQPPTPTLTAPETTDAIAYSPASPSPSQQYGSEPDVFAGYTSVESDAEDECIQESSWSPESDASREFDSDEEDSQGSPPRIVTL